MKTPLVMTIIGEDKPGLVDAISKIVADCGGNWLESRMAHLGGHFAGILRLDIDEEARDGLLASLRGLESRGLTVVVREDEGKPVPRPSHAAVLEVVGQDRPGIIRSISHALASHAVNVEELTTECYSAPMTGELLFRAKAFLRIPDDGNLHDLRADLEKLADELMVDLSLQESIRNMAET